MSERVLQGGRQHVPVAFCLRHECGGAKVQDAAPWLGLPRSAGGSEPARHLLSSLRLPRQHLFSPVSPPCVSSVPAGGAAGCQAHQDMEVDPFTVFLAGGEQDGSVGISVPTLIQVGSRRVPPLIHGSIVSDAWRRRGRNEEGGATGPPKTLCLSSKRAS